MLLFHVSILKYSYSVGDFFDIIPAINDENGVDQYYAFKSINRLCIFAFMFMLLREIVKDIEDVDGDMTLKMKHCPFNWP